MPVRTWPGSQELLMLGAVKETVFGQDINLSKSCFGPPFLGKDKGGENKTKEYTVEGICWFCLPSIHSPFF